MKIYTGAGDKGYTSVPSVEGKVLKNHELIEFFGTADEFSASLSIAKIAVSESDMDELSRAEIITVLSSLQEQLILFNGFIAGGKPFDFFRYISETEKLIDSYQSKGLSFSGFIFQGTEKSATYIDFARTIARKLERFAVNARHFVTDSGLIYLNRISDLLYVLCLYSGYAERIKKTINMTLETRADDKNISLENALMLIKAVDAKARKVGVKAVIAVCDTGANLVAFQKADGAFIGSIEVAINKAFTSAAFKKETDEIGRLTVAGQSLEGLQNTNGQRIITFGGGAPLFKSGIFYGSIGISGGNAQEDTGLANNAKKIFSGM